MMTAEEKAQAIKDLIWDRMDIEVTVDPGDVEGVTDIDTFERIVDVDRAISEQSDIIYYSRAMAYLSKADPSLREAFEAAAEYDTRYKTFRRKFLHPSLMKSVRVKSIGIYETRSRRFCRRMNRTRTKNKEDEIWHRNRDMWWVL